MKMNSKRRTAAIMLAGALLMGVSGYATTAAFAEEKSYYVCFSNQNYAVRNANKLTQTEEGYILENVTLSSAQDFYVTDNAGARWYGNDDEPLSVEEAGTLAYDLIFSPDTAFTAEGEWAQTDCHISYRFYTPAQYAVAIDGQEVALTYNPYRTDIELYYISSIALNGGATVSYGGEEHAVKADGFYRILYTPSKTTDGNTYRFDENGNYGSGDGYDFELYIEDAPQYYAVFEEFSVGADERIGGKDAVLMTRYEKNTGAAEYRTPAFFVAERDYAVKYAIYEKTVGGSFKLIDDDNDEDTEISRLTATDAGWFTLGMTDLDGRVLPSLNGEEKSFGGWYAVGDFNGYGYDEYGLPALDGKYAFAEVEEGDDDYDEDYDQYILYFYVTEKDLKGGDVEFYITDGKTKYKNGGDYIALNTAGKYKILFSEEHIYGRGRNYRYVLEDEDKEYTELTIGSAREFCDFAEKCSRSADYSVNLKVYLTADIDFEGVPFVSVGNFSGIFYGGYHTLKNITLEDGGDQTAVFALVTRTATVERLNVENVNLGSKDCDYVGFIGRNYGTVRYVTVSGRVTGRNYVGGIAAYNGRSVVDDDAATVDSNDVVSRAALIGCTGNATVCGETYVGGLGGFNSGEIYGCTSTGRVAGNKNKATAVINVGGIAGYSAGKIYDCTNDGEIDGGTDSLYVGGIAGLSAGEIYFAFNHGNVSASAYAGGICGYYGTVENNGDDLDNYFGGVDYETFLGNYFADSGDDFEQAEGDAHIIDYCINDGAVTALSYAGGILGNSRAATLQLYNSASTGDISATAGSYAGGIAGYCTDAEIKGCLSSGLIEAKGLGGGNYVGGIVGYGGNVAYCMSAATVKGADYVGGIAGYASSEVRGCYTNVLVTAADGSVNTGAVAGFAQAYNMSLNSFGGKVAGNYYVGAVGGIQGKDYAAGYDYAAAWIESGKLSSDGMLSPYLCEDFSRDYWQGGNGENSYPTLSYFEESDDCDEFGDDELWGDLFGKYQPVFAGITAQSARLTYTVTFMEWNKDNGSLYDDGVLQTDNFDIVSTVRGYAGQTVASPLPVYAEQKGDVWVYEGDEARYFVSFPAEVTVGSNVTVYAEYCEIVTSLSDADNLIFAEGDFRTGTQVELVRVGDSYTLRFTLGGEPIDVGAVNVKFFVGDDAADYTVYLVDGQNKVAQDSAVSGGYLSFAWNGGYFCAEAEGASQLPYWAWLLIGVAVAAGAGAVAVGCTVLVKRKKSAK